MADEDVTLGEVYRLIVSLQKDVREQSRSFMTLELWASEKRGLDDRDARKGIEIRDLKSENAALEARIDADKRVKSQQWFAIGLASFVAILSVIGQVVAFTVNNGGGA